MTVEHHQRKTSRHNLVGSDEEDEGFTEIDSNGEVQTITSHKVKRKKSTMSD